MQVHRSQSPCTHITTIIVFVGMIEVRLRNRAMFSLLTRMTIFHDCFVLKILSLYGGSETHDTSQQCCTAAKIKLVRASGNTFRTLHIIITHFNLLFCSYIIAFQPSWNLQKSWGGNASGTWIMLLKRELFKDCHFASVTQHTNIFSV